MTEPQVLHDEVNPAGDRVLLTSTQEVSARGRVVAAALRLTCGDQVLFEGPDTAASASQWRPALAAARTATAPAAGGSGDDGAPAKPRKRKGTS